MWTLTEINARNICSFGKMGYKVRQGVASLIFGENEDDGENQQHNGSGKSSFIECIAFGITGEAFRKVDTIEDIIRDDEDYAEVELRFANGNTGMVISRRIERGESQKVSVIVTRDGSEEEIPFVSVLEMNRRIYELLGISKDDLYHNYLLNENRFKSFFSSSDKEKKEIINTFSNGIIVDEAIDKLKLDMDRIEVDEMMPARSECSRIDGALDAIRQQIEDAENSKESEEKDRKDRIQALRDKVAEKRAENRSSKDEIGSINAKIDECRKCLAAIEQLKGMALPLSELDKSIRSNLMKVNLDSELSDWDARIRELQGKKKDSEALIEDLGKELAGLKAKFDRSRTELEESGAEYTRLKAKYDASNESDEKEIGIIQKELAEYNDEFKKIDDEILKYIEETAKLKHESVKLSSAISGAVECPNCHHKFVLDGNVSVDSLREGLRECLDRSSELERKKDSRMHDKKGVLEDIENCKLDIKDIRDDIQKRSDKLADMFRNGQQLRQVFNGNTQACNDVSDRIAVLNKEIGDIENKIAKVQEDMMFEALDIIEDEIDGLGSECKKAMHRVSENESAIEVYEKSMKELENVSVTDHVDKLKATLKAKEKEKKEADRKLAGLQASYNELSEQESRFVNFKTHLANTKISSIAQITNQVLKDTKSPIRVKLSGYTVTKTGKVRDKISISVTKHGIDAGSFLKCSAGERARIMFANIVAMHRMTNLTSPSGGLNLICIDEIMDSCEEAGLMSVAEMANQLGITLLMITQGKTSESYPHQIVVTKRLGVSVLKEKYGKDTD